MTTMALPSAYRENLEAALDPSRQKGQIFKLTAPADELGCVDFGSNNTLSLGGSGATREELLRELARNPNFAIGTGGSRLLGGTTQYIDELERDLAHFYNADEGLIFPSGYEGNVAIHATLPQTGDAIIHDAKIHASSRDGMRSSKAHIIRPFAHNDPHSLYDVLEEVKLLEPAIADGLNTVFVTIESIYSMDGDVAPVPEIVNEVKRALPKGNLVMILDEAHSHGIVGPSGAGLACQLGLEHEFAVRLHTFGKAIGAGGGIILCDGLIKRYLVSYARNFMFTTAPAFTFFATIKAAVSVMSSEEGDWRRKQLQDRIYHFYDLLFHHPQWEHVRRSGILSIPTTDHFMKGSSFLVPIIPLITQPGYSHRLEKWLLDRGMHTHGVRYPIVSMAKERVRVMIHVENTTEQVEALVKSIMEWADQYAPSLSPTTIKLRL
ncbi:pyridoxal phosphate-dependent transferase [Aspergillus novoparasiticus]|uniref:Pyridoxal phosphate-dependent transferase n=1 Tax=Aspergillus novoparasiticus TaxID=986946 RepID=A0A5N6E837_9EURO|nr:pyridoxal phosphate-dependent transferase [Aspergillus novoparasiticus]